MKISASTPRPSPGSEVRRSSDRIESIRIVRIPHPPVIIHEVTDDELKRQQAGTPDSRYFSLFLSLCLASVSIIASLLLPYTLLLWILAALFFGMGLAFGVVWFLRDKSQSERSLDNWRDSENEPDHGES